MKFFKSNVEREKTGVKNKKNHPTPAPKPDLKLLHTDALTYSHFYTQTLLHAGAFTHRRFYTQTLLHTAFDTQTPVLTALTDAFTHICFYTQTLLHTDAFTQTLWHTDDFTGKHF